MAETILPRAASMYLAPKKLSRNSNKLALRMPPNQLVTWDTSTSHP